MVICLSDVEHKTDSCHIDISKVGEETCKALQGIHAFNGCDSLDDAFGAFIGWGKVSALKLFMKGDRLQKAMEGLGTGLVLSSEELFTLLQEFVCKVYASQTSLCQ